MVAAILKRPVVVRLKHFGRRAQGAIRRPLGLPGDGREVDRRGRVHRQLMRDIGLELEPEPATIPAGPAQ